MKKEDGETVSLTDDEALELEASGEIVHLACPSGHYAIYVHRDHQHAWHPCLQCGSALVHKPRVVRN